MSKLGCVLEAVHTLKLKGFERPSAAQVASELKLGVEEASKMLEEAVAKGWLVEAEGGYCLTDLGLEELHRHREEEVHDRLAHGAGIGGRLARAVEGKVANLDEHWRARHGLNGAELADLHKGFMEVEGRVEDLRPLAGLSAGSRGVVVFAVGGRGLTRRLAEMGLTPGAEVKVLRKAPLRGPVEVQVRGVCLALGFGVASKVIVKPLG